MEISDVISQVNDAWDNSLPERRIHALKSTRKLIKECHLELFDALVDAKISGIKDDPKSIVLILIHGIQTDGAWHHLVQNEFKDSSGINVISLGYECVTAAQLVGPFRAAPTEKIEREIRDLKRRESSARLMVIAHSFGSYIVSEIIKKHSDINFEKIVFCGSIIPRNYRWDIHAKDMPRGSIINDVGTSDVYPILATCFSYGYGASGYRGFQNSLILDRYFPYGHSTFFDRKRKHIKRFWRPFIESGSIRRSRWDTLKPKSSLISLIFSHPIIGRAIIFLIIFYFYFYF